MAYSRRELGRLERRYDLRSWPLPRRARVSSDGMWLEWSYPRKREPERMAGRRKPFGLLLGEFIDLSDSAGTGRYSARHIEDFARRWGVFHHQGQRGPGAKGRDSLTRWVHVIGGFRGILGLSEALRTGRAPATHDLRLAMRLLPRGTYDPYARRVRTGGSAALSPTPSRRERSLGRERADWLDTTRHVLKVATQSLLRTAGAAPILVLDPESRSRLRLEIGGGTLKAGLATQLLYAVTASEGGSSFCDGCGRSHVPRRRSSVGRRSFCEACRQQGVDNRVRVRDHRAYQRSRG